MRSWFETDLRLTKMAPLGKEEVRESFFLFFNDYSSQSQGVKKKDFSLIGSTNTRYSTGTNPAAP